MKKICALLAFASFSIYAMDYFSSAELVLLKKIPMEDYHATLTHLKNKVRGISLAIDHSEIVTADEKVGIELLIQAHRNGQLTIENGQAKLKNTILPKYRILGEWRDLKQKQLEGKIQNECCQDSSITCAAAICSAAYCSLCACGPTALCVKASTLLAVTYGFCIPASISQGKLSNRIDALHTDIRRIFENISKREPTFFNDMDFMEKAAKNGHKEAQDVMYQLFGEKY